MKNLLFALLLHLFSSGLLMAQPVLSHIEDFAFGETARYASVQDSENIMPGTAGPRVIWDFDKLKIDPADLLIQEIVEVKTTKFKDVFPDATFAEKNSDGSWVFQQKKGNQNMVWGVVSTEGLEMKNLTPYIFLKRPLKYGDSLSGSCEREYILKGEKISGINNYKTIADAYGTLKINGKVYKNVLRVKFVQSIEDRSSAGSTMINVVSYGWFDSKSKMSLLKFDIIKINNKWYTNTESEIRFLIDNRKQ